MRGLPLLRLDPRSAGEAPALLLADLHLGLGGTPRQPGGPPEGSAEALAVALVEAAGRERAARVIVVGDVKHPIVGTPPALRPVVFRFFATLLGAGVGAEVVLGNHDVGLVPHLPKEVVVHPATGASVADVGVFHGHRWPSDEVLRSRTWVVGHLHPGYRFAPTAESPSGKQRCWLRVRYPHPPPGRRPPPPNLGGEELIVLPAFNPLTGTEALNHDRPRRGRSFLFARFIRTGAARAYLLDGTDLGPLTNLAPDDQRREGARRARRPK